MSLFSANINYIKSKTYLKEAVLGSWPGHREYATCERVKRGRLKYERPWVSKEDLEHQCSQLKYFSKNSVKCLYTKKIIKCFAYLFICLEIFDPASDYLQQK